MLVICLTAIEKCLPEAECEVIVVTNNCSDASADRAGRFPFVRVVDEPNTAFSKARDTGAKAAIGEFLLFMDDDAILQPGALMAAIKIFKTNENCAIIAGKIEPEFIREPPAWTLRCQEKHNAWSLYMLEIPSTESSNVINVQSACGPLMIVRRSVYWQVGGFPPDTIGVETNSGSGNFMKLYVGPGDYGLSTLVRNAGYSILYSNEVAVRHVIPDFRMTVQFWISRYWGEGSYMAITESQFFRLNRLQSARSAIGMRKRLAQYRLRTVRKLPTTTDVSTLSPDEIDMILAESYLATKRLLRRHKNLAELLWNLAAEGVSDADFEAVLATLPEAYLRLVNLNLDLVAANPNRFRAIRLHSISALKKS
jgi:glycosyltransferase involved in cell wall biosynthesis